MTTKEIRSLERLAIQGHRRGIGWRDFQAEHADAIRAAEPWLAEDQETTP